RVNGIQISSFWAAANATVCPSSSISPRTPCSTPPRVMSWPYALDVPDLTYPSMDAVPHQIRIEVETAYLDEQSDPKERRYVFSYTITKRNEGLVSARLLHRTWVITDANGKVQEVRGDGVVGEQPHLKPGQGFRYSSGAVIEKPVGSMRASYQMLADAGMHFDAPIPPFRLAMPGIVQ